MKGGHDEDLSNLAARARPDSSDHRPSSCSSSSESRAFSTTSGPRTTGLRLTGTLANHLMSALKFRQVFSDLFHVSFGGQGGLLSFLKQLVFVNTFVHPPLFPFTASLLSPALAIRSLVMVNGVFLVVLVLAVYGLAGGSTAIWPGF